MSLDLDPLRGFLHPDGNAGNLFGRVRVAGCDYVVRAVRGHGLEWTLYLTPRPSGEVDEPAGQGGFHRVL